MPRAVTRFSRQLVCIVNDLIYGWFEGLRRNGDNMGATFRPRGKYRARASAESALVQESGDQGSRGALPAWIAGPSLATSTIAWPFILVGGLIAGVVWGVNARLWMRYISTDPEFTWGGTLFIIIGFAIVGLSQATACLARRRIITRWKLTLTRTATFAGLLPIFGGAGALMAPTVLLGTLAASHQRWPRWFRVACGLGATLPVVAVSASVYTDFALLHWLLATIWLVVIYAVVIWAAQATLAPQLDGWLPPTALRLLGFALLLPVLGGAGLALLGVS